MCVQVREAVGSEAAVLGFAGAPYTLASYIVEGGSSKNYSELKRMAFSDPAVLHALLDKLTANVTDYCRYQADNGAQARPSPTTCLPLAFPALPSAPVALAHCIEPRSWVLPLRLVTSSLPFCGRVQPVVSWWRLLCHRDAGAV